MVTQRLRLSAPEPFWLDDVIFAHGWVRLLPYRWDEDTRTLSRIERLPSGRFAHLAIRSPARRRAVRTIDAEVCAPEPITGGDDKALRAGLRRAFALDEQFDAWWYLCGEDPGLQQAHSRRQGRMLRSPTLFEDVVKTVCSINTTWSQTKSMVRHLITHFGSHAPALGEEARAFPSVLALASADPHAVRDRARVGYRADTLVGIARAVLEGPLDQEGLQDSSLPDDAVADALRAVRGLGPYAVAHVMMLLGRYDFLPIDTWLRRTVREGWFSGRPATDREITAAFERFRPYRSLAFRFYDWQGALRREVWTEPEGVKG